MWHPWHRVLHPLLCSNRYWEPVLYLTLIPLIIYSMSAVVSDLSSLIDRRLARLEYDLRGPNHQTWDDKHANETHDKNNTIKTQIARLGNRLKELESQSVQAVDLLKLCMCMWKE